VNFPSLQTPLQFSHGNGATENARNEISAPSKMQVLKIRDMKIQVRKKRDMKIRDMKMREMKIREKCDFGLGEH